MLDVNGINIIYGEPATGKSVLVKYLIFSALKRRDINFVVVFTMSPGDYEYLPDGNVYTQYTQDKLARILKNQKSNPARKTLLVFDDMVGGIDFGDKLFFTLNSQFRHFSVVPLYTCQYFTKVNKTVRCLAVKVFVFRISNACCQGLFEECADRYFANYREFREYVYSKVVNHQFIIINKLEGEMAGRFSAAKVDISKLPNSNVVFIYE